MLGAVITEKMKSKVKMDKDESNKSFLVSSLRTDRKIQVVPG